MHIAPGGWVSAKRVALVCVDFPTGHGNWGPANDFVHGFHFLRGVVMTADGRLLPGNMLNAIHWVHLVGAVGSFLAQGYVACCAIWLQAMRGPSTRGAGASIRTRNTGNRLAKVSGTPALPVAVSHNGVAALLLGAPVMLNFATRLPSPFGR